MSETMSVATARAAGLRLEDLSDSEILDMIKRAPEDPHVAREVLHLQKQAGERMAASVQKMVAKLNEVAPDQGKLSSGPVSVVALASAAREREAASKQKRELAASLVIGALINQDNPDWKIFDDTAEAPPQDQQTESGFLALLRMTLP